LKEQLVYGNTKTYNKTVLELKPDIRLHWDKIKKNIIVEEVDTKELYRMENGNLF
jgi:hypothetical protein